MKRIVLGMIVIAIGVIMALYKADIVDFSWFNDYEVKKYIIPAIIILVGLRLITLRTRRGKDHCDGMQDVDLSNMKEGEIINTSMAFSGSRYNMTDQMFNGAKFDVFCGGVSLDLYGAEIADNCVIEVHTLMGGVEIKAPSNVRFQVSSSCFMGGVDNKHSQNSDNCTKTIYLKADCMLGGVEIK